MFVAKHLPLTVAGGVHVTSPSTSQEDRRSFVAQGGLPSAEEKEKEREKKKKTAVVLGGGKIPTWEVYLENDEFFFYTSTVRNKLKSILSPSTLHREKPHTYPDIQIDT